MKNRCASSVLFSACLFACGAVPVFAQNFGSVKVGESGTATITVPVSTAGTVGSISVRLLGAENLDFTNAGGGTCAVGIAYAAEASCTVKVTFAPKYAGARNGAVVLFGGVGGTGAQLAEMPIYGVGRGPQVAFGPNAVQVVVPQVENGIPLFLQEQPVLDGAGDLFVPDFSDNLVLKVPAGGGTPLFIHPTVNGLPLYYPEAVALNGAGDLFIADNGNLRIVRVPSGGGAPETLTPAPGGVGLYGPSSLAFDAAGNLYIGDDGGADNCCRIVEVPALGGPPVAMDPTVDGLPLRGADALAVDSSGDLFIGDLSRIVEVPAGGGAPSAIPDASYPTKVKSLAVDSAGNLFFTVYIYVGNVLEIPAGGASPILLQFTGGSPYSYIESVALDAAGNLFMGDYLNQIVEAVRTAAPETTYATTQVGMTSPDSPRTVQVQNIGNQSLIFTGFSYPADFPMASGDSSACTLSSNLTPGQQCDLPIDFSPKSPGNLSENVTLTDNALNLSGSMQAIAVSGDAFGAQTITFAALPNVVYPVAPVTLTATASSGLAVSYTATGPAKVSGSTLIITGGGTVSVTASQPGNSTYGPATPVTRTFTVFLPATVKPQSSLPTQTLGWPVTFTAAVAGAGPTPTGTVTFFAASTSLGSGTLVSGVASFTTSSLALGSHAITAKYSGDANYTAATSSSITQTITNTPTLALAASSNPAAAYAPFTLTATVEFPIGGAVPTGTVLFYEDGQHLGLVTLSGGVATWKISGLAPAEYSFGAQYNGDKNYKGVPSTGLWLTVDKAVSTVTVSASPNPAALGVPVTITATVATTLSGKTPTGTVRFFNLHTLIGQGTLSGGQASITLNNLPGGDNQIVVEYTGDANYTSSDSNFLYERVSDQPANQTPASIPTPTNPAPAIPGQTVAPSKTGG